jgi:hypothetical protein
MKFIIALAAITCLFFLVNSFTTKNEKPSATVTFYYDNTVGLTRGGINLGTMVLIQSEVKNTANWVTTMQTNAPGAYLNSITFDMEPGDVTNGITDGQYSLLEAVNAVWDEYMKYGLYDLPTHNNMFTPSVPGASPITIGRSPFSNR